MPALWGGGRSVKTHVLIDIVLPNLERALAHLKAHLGGLIVHEATEGWRKAAATALRRLLSHVDAAVGAAVVALLRLRWWRPELRDGGDMLGDGVVERRGVRWWWAVAALHI